MGGLEAELGEEGADFGGFRVGDGRGEGVEEGLGAEEEPASLVDLADEDARAERGVARVQGDPAEQRAQEGRLAGRRSRP